MKTREEVKKWILELAETTGLDRYDSNYLDDLPYLLREVYGFSPEEFLARRMNDEQNSKYGHDRVPTWEKARNSTNPDDINRIQIDYSYFLRGGNKRRAFDDLFCVSLNSDPWTPLILENVQPGSRALCVGCRWEEEVKFFRDILRLDAVGLDLFSVSELVITGDMHQMPFTNGEFKLVYSRNTLNKSRDPRLALSEMARVASGGGIVIIDDMLGYTEGVSPVNRTNVKTIEWYKKFLGLVIDRVLYSKEIPIIDDDSYTNRGLLALKLK